MNTFEESYGKICDANGREKYSTMDEMLHGIDTYLNGERKDLVDMYHDLITKDSEQIHKLVDKIVSKIAVCVDRFAHNATDEQRITCIDALTFAVTQSIENECYQRVAFGEL